MTKYSDRNHPFFAPLWRRLLIVAACTAWAFVEWYNDAGLWVTVALGVTGYAIWSLLIGYKVISEEASGGDGS